MIKLAPLQKEDFKKIIEWNEGKSADFLLQWSGPFYKYPLTQQQFESYFNNYISKEKGKLFVFKIIYKETNEMIGTIELDIKDTVNKIARVARFLIGEDNLRGKGIGREALKEVVRFGFEDLNLNKITLGVFDFNKNAIRCYESVGFKIETLKEKYRESENGWWNLYDMGIAKEQWLSNAASN
jgi:RimJ/RimL family protein N-acetyltransferase